MMTSFWLATLAMLLIAIVFVVVPWFSYQQKVTKSGQTSDWFHSREQELHKEHLAGKYTEQEYQEAVQELKVTAKDELLIAKKSKELAPESQQHTLTHSRWYLLAASVVLVVLVAGFYLNKGLYKQVEDWQQTLLKMPELSQKVIQNLDSQVSEQELKEFALGLRTKLASQEDHIGWMLLGRVLKSLQDIEGAIAAFEKSYNMEQNNVSNTVSYAQALQMKGEEFELKRSVQLLQQALTLKPDNELAIILFGEGNLSLERYEIAKQGFDFALQVLQKDDPRIGAIQQRLAFIDQQLNGKAQNAVNVQVDIAPELIDKMSGFSHLFVFAKTQQMPMPIAVKKLSIGQMPMRVSLSDSDIMIAGQKLSDYKTVSIFARLSVDDNAPFEAGDWQGHQSNIDTTNSEVVNTIIINKGFN